MVVRNTASFSTGINFTPLNVVHPHSYPPEHFYPSYSPYQYQYPYPCQPTHSSPTPSALTPFTLCFIKGNIAMCIGCHNRYLKSRQPPNDLCIRHQEWRKYIPQGSDTPQTNFLNVYYRCKPEWCGCAVPTLFLQMWTLPRFRKSSLQPISHIYRLLCIFLSLHIYIYQYILLFMVICTSLKVSFLF